MASLPADQAGTELANLIARVSQSHEPIEITAREGNAVLLAEEDWRAIQETLYLVSIPGMAKSIRDGMETPAEQCEEQLDW